MQNQQFTIQQVFLQESKNIGWMNETNPNLLFGGVRKAMENTRRIVANQCYGNQTRIDACNALFREAQAGVDLALQTLTSTQLTCVQPQQPVQQPAQQETEGVTSEKMAPWLQLALVVGGFACCFLTSRKDLLLVLAILLLGVASVLQAKHLLETVDIPGILKFVAKIIPNKHVRKWVGNAIAKNASKKKAKAANTPAPAQTAAPTGQIQQQLDVQAIENACLAQLKLIEANLPIFLPPVVQKDDSEELWSLVRTMLQQRYADHVVYPQDVEEEIQRYLDINGIQLMDYSEDTAHLFQTQPMDETFTIFPAVIKDGNLEEYGRAGVKEA